MAKLVAIGDSLTHGFQSGAIRQAGAMWSYPAMIARALGGSVGVPSRETSYEFRVPFIPGSGLPINLEDLLRTLSMDKGLGDDIKGLAWLKLPRSVASYIDKIEDFYERGDGSLKGGLIDGNRFRGLYHNLGVFGFRVADAFTIDPAYCLEQSRRKERLIDDDLFGLPSASMYRGAYQVLNPGNNRSRHRLVMTQVDALREIHQKEGVENLILFLGSNDCLGTVASLKLEQMPPQLNSDDPEERRRYNLTSPEVFERDYRTLVDEIAAIIGSSTQVFVGTVPYVTIPPISQGVGDKDKDNYFERYSSFYVEKKRFVPVLNRSLTREEVRHIDETIDQFNDIIKTVIREAGANWHLVETGELLKQLAVKRNDAEEEPERPLREHLQKFWEADGDHPLLGVTPLPSTLLLESKDNQRVGGGLFSLDNIHPTTVGYGLVAELFLKAMKEAGVSNADPQRLGWDEIIAQDTLLTDPPTLWDDVIQAAGNTSPWWDGLIRALMLF